MASFIIEGGHKLHGEIIPQGAKNEALEVISAILLTAEPVIIRNVPNILDVNNLIGLLSKMGVRVTELESHNWQFQADNLDMEYLGSQEFVQRCAALRGSILTLGPLLARFHKACVAKPGGDQIGRRRLDTHFIGIQELGAKFNYSAERGVYEIDANELRGTRMLLDEASVTGTANIIMTAVLAQGTTTIYNAACEPYIQQLCRMLNQMGAKISGISSNLLTIEGVKELHGTDHTILPDMIEVGSFIGMAAMTGSDITIKNVSYENLGIIPQAFSRLGITIEHIGDDIHIPEHQHYEVSSFMDGSTMAIADAPWPGLTPSALCLWSPHRQRVRC